MLNPDRRLAPRDPASESRSYRIDGAIRGLLGALALGATACGKNASPTTSATVEASTIVQGPLATRIDQYLKRAARYGFSGEVLVAKDGQIVLQAGYGLADRERKRPVTPSTVFSIGSITKQFTAAAILALEERGKLRTTDPLSRFFPEAPADKAGITIHQLLTHTAGFPDALGDDYERVSRDSLLRLAFGKPLDLRPGDHYQYSNVGYSILAAIVEKTSGQPYETFLRQTFWDRLGMTETGYDRPWPVERLAIGYRDTTRWGTSVEKWQPGSPGWHVVGNGEVHSTVGDLYRWVVALDSGKVLVDSSRKKLITPYVPEDQSGQSRYGYGWVLSSTTWGSDEIWHDGGNGYFFAKLERFPNDRLVVVFLTNASSNEPMARSVVDLAFDRPVPMIPAAADSAPGDLGHLAGTYRSPGGIEFGVQARDDELWVVGDDPEVRMLFVALTPTGATPAGPPRRVITDQEALTILRGLGRKDWKPLLEFLRPPPEAQATVTDRWAGAVDRWTQSLGPPNDARLLGLRITETEPARRFELYGLIRFARGARVIRFVEREGMGPEDRSVVVVPPRAWPALPVILAPAGPGRFTSYVAGFRSALRVRFEGEGLKTTMVLEEPDRELKLSRVPPPGTNSSSGGAPRS